MKIQGNITWKCYAWHLACNWCSIQGSLATVAMILCGNPVESKLPGTSFLLPVPDLTLLSVMAAQVCPLISEILRQLDVKLLKSLMGECLHPSREENSG